MIGTPCKEDSSSLPNQSVAEMIENRSSQEGVVYSGRTQGPTAGRTETDPSVRWSGRNNSIAQDGTSKIVSGGLQAQNIE